MMLLPPESIYFYYWQTIKVGMDHLNTVWDWIDSEGSCPHCAVWFISFLLSSGLLVYQLKTPCFYHDSSLLMGPQIHFCLPTPDIAYCLLSLSFSYPWLSLYTSSLLGHCFRIGKYIRTTQSQMAGPPLWISLSNRILDLYVLTTLATSQSFHTDFLIALFFSLFLAGGLVWYKLLFHYWKEKFYNHVLINGLLVYRYLDWE